MAEDVKFNSASGATTLGALAMPPGSDAAPGLVVIQEWHGVNAHIRSVVDRLAEEGFVALAVDLYDGQIAKDDAHAQQLMNELKWPVALEKIAGGVQYLAGHPRSNGKVGVVGFCLGGAAAMLAAANVPGLSAAVPYYGFPPEGAIDWAKLKVPMQGHFAKVDHWVKPEAVTAAHMAVARHGGTFEVFFYDAGHAFNRDTDPTKYDAASAKTAWTRATGFLHKHLG